MARHPQDIALPPGATEIAIREAKKPTASAIESTVNEIDGQMTAAIATSLATEMPVNETHETNATLETMCIVNEQTTEIHETETYEIRAPLIETRGTSAILAVAGKCVIIARGIDESHILHADLTIDEQTLDPTRGQNAKNPLR